MCRPDHYTIAYEINPWMNINNPTDHAKARRQWNRLYQFIQNSGSEISLIEPAEGLPDMVFTANAALVYEDKVILSRFRHSERQGEERYFANWFSQQGYKCYNLPDGISFEGEGDTVYYRDILLLAHGFRTDIASHPCIESIVGREYKSLKLIDPHFYHLDTCLLFIEPIDLLIYYPGAFHPESVKEIEDLPSKILRLSEGDAKSFVCNSIWAGCNLLSYKCPDSLAAKLRGYGLNIITLDISEFMKSGGSVRCMVLHLS